MTRNLRRLAAVAAIAPALCGGQARAAETVESWPPLHIIVLDQHQQFRTVRDRIFKWTYVPYTQARNGLKQADEEMSQLYQQDGAAMANPFLIFLPAIQRIRFLDARLARDIAMLRCIEAIRMYAADHGGKLPRSLAEITAVPLPTDPLNGGAFHYELAGGKAVLESDIPPDGCLSDRAGQRHRSTAHPDMETTSHAILCLRRRASLHRVQPGRSAAGRARHSKTERVRHEELDGQAWGPGRWPTPARTGSSSPHPHGLWNAGRRNPRYGGRS